MEQQQKRSQEYKNQEDYKRQKLLAYNENLKFLIILQNIHCIAHTLKSITIEDI